MPAPLRLLMQQDMMNSAKSTHMGANMLRKFYVLVLLSLVPAWAGAWTISDDFEKGAVGSKVSTFGANGRTVYSTEHVYEGKQSAKMTIRKGEEGYGLWGGYVAHPKRLRKGDELWLRFRAYFPEGFDHYSYSGGGRLKFLRHDTRNGSTGRPEGYVDIYFDTPKASSAFKFIFEGQQKWSNIGTKSNDLPRLGSWETYEYYVKFDSVPKSEGGEATVRFWKNGELIGEINNLKTLKYSDSYTTRTLLWTYWNGGAPQTQSMWIDDLVLTSDTPAGRDKHGNPYVGVGQGQHVSPPAAPQLKVTQ